MQRSFTVTCKINQQHLSSAILLSISLEIFPPLIAQCLEVDSVLSVIAELLKAKDSKGQFYVEGHAKDI